MGPSFASPRWVPSSHGDTQQVMLHMAAAITLHPVPLTIAQNLQQGSVGLSRA